MSQVIISKTGLTRRHWNSDRRGEHTVKKKNGLYTIVNDASGEVVSAAPTAEEAEEFFYDEETPPKNVWACLRDPVELRDDVTAHDVFRIVENNEMLFSLTTSLLAGFAVFHDSEPSGENVDDVVLHQAICVHDGILKIRFDSNYVPEYSHTPLRLKQTIEFDGMECEWSWTLLDLLQHLFGDLEDQAPIALTPYGLLNEHGVGIFDPMHHLFAPCTLSDDFTLRDLVDFVAGNEDLKDFIACYSWCGAIDEFHQQANLPPKTDGILHQLEIYRSGEVFRWKEGKNRVHHVSLNIGYDFHGLGVPDEYMIEHHQKYGGELPEEQNYSVSYTPLNELVHLPLKLDETVEVREFVSDTRENKLHLKCRKPFTLLEILDAVYWDISFHGGPQDNEEFLEELKQRSDEIDKGIAKTHGPFDTVEELFRDMAARTDDDLCKEAWNEMADERENNNDSRSEQDAPDRGV